MYQLGDLGKTKCDLLVLCLLVERAGRLVEMPKDGIYFVINIRVAGKGKGTDLRGDQKNKFNLFATSFFHVKRTLVPGSAPQCHVGTFHVKHRPSKAC